MSTLVFPSNIVEARLAAAQGLVSEFHAANLASAKYPAIIGLASVAPGFLFKAAVTSDFTTAFGATYVWNTVKRGIQAGLAKVAAAGIVGNLIHVAYLQPLKANGVAQKFIFNAQTAAGLAIIQTEVENALTAMRKALATNPRLDDGPRNQPNPGEYVGEPAPAEGELVFPGTPAEAALLDYATIAKLVQQNIATAKKATQVSATAFRQGTLFRIEAATDTGTAFGDQFFRQVFGSAANITSNIARIKKLAGFLPIHLDNPIPGMESVYDIRQTAMLKDLEDTLSHQMQWLRSQLDAINKAVADLGIDGDGTPVAA